jgi:hypothetical protein
VPLVHSQVTLGTAATEIVGHDNTGHQVVISNNSIVGDLVGVTGSVFIGSASVTAATGLKLKAGETVVFTLPPGDRLFAVSSPTAVVVSVLNVRQPD